MRAASSAFPERVANLFGREYARLHRFLDRMAGDADVAADLAQESFVRLLERGSMPDQPESWLVTVALNLFRNQAKGGARRTQLLAIAGAAAQESNSDSNADSAATALTVRQAIARLDERQRAMLLLRAEGYSYREIARMLDIQEASLGTLLARSRKAFLEEYNK